jgi:hypothetical protein
MNPMQIQNQKDLLGEIDDNARRIQIMYQIWKENRDSHWARLQKAREEYVWREGFTFTHWLEQKYGIQLILDNAGNITSNYKIVDEKKYSLYLLKYS